MYEFLAAEVFRLALAKELEIKEKKISSLWIIDLTKGLTPERIKNLNAIKGNIGTILKFFLVLISKISNLFL